MPEADRGSVAIPRGPRRDTPARSQRDRGNSRKTPARRATPAQRARHRRIPAVENPPAATNLPTLNDLDDLLIEIKGRRYRIGVALTGEILLDETIDAVATLTLRVHDRDSVLLNALADESARLSADAVRLEVAGVRWALTGVTATDNNVLSLAFEDEVAWQMRRDRTPKTWSRARYTRAEAVYSMVQEAGRGRRRDIQAFIPELVDPQRILPPDAGD